MHVYKKIIKISIFILLILIILIPVGVKYEFLPTLQKVLITYNIAMLIINICGLIYICIIEKNKD